MNLPIKNKNGSTVQIGVIGGGSWATALVKILAENKNIKVRWWMRDRADVRYVSTFRRNPKYLRGVRIPRRKVKPSFWINRVVEKSDIIVLATPSAFIKNVMTQLRPAQLRGKFIVSAIKGMVSEDNVPVTTFLQEHFSLKESDFAVIGGPCHSEEVASELQSYLTIASKNKEKAENFGKLLRCDYVKVSIIDDLYGEEYAAIMKNIFAIGCGIAHGLNYGDNFQAVLVSNAMQEMKRFLDKVHPEERDLNASAYLGDLVVTVYSQFSRNRTFGNMIGRGYSVKSAQVEMDMVAEGFFAVKSIMEMNKTLGVDMPITEAVYKTLHEDAYPAEVFAYLEDKLH